MRKTTEIRKAMVALIDPLAIFKTYSNSRRNIAEDKLPVAVVTIANGSYDVETFDDMETNVTATVMITTKSNTIDDELDRLAEFVEPLFPLASTLGGLVEGVTPSLFQYIIDPNSDIGTMVLSYEITYIKG